MQHFCSGVPKLLVGLKLDLRNNPQTIAELAKVGQKPVTFEQVRVGVDEGGPPDRALARGSPAPMASISGRAPAHAAGPGRGEPDPRRQVHGVLRKREDQRPGGLRGRHAGRAHDPEGQAEELRAALVVVRSRYAPAPDVAAMVFERPAHAVPWAALFGGWSP